ncbi:MAG: T9SS type A sorting domain-containing protein [Bacteroidia bacterium]
MIKINFAAHVRAFLQLPFLAFSLVLVFGFSQAQPVTAYFDPPEFENNDVIDLIIEYGSVDDPVQNAMSAHFEIAYDGFEIDPSSKLSVDAGGSSWFGWDEGYTSRIVVNHSLHLIIVDLERTESPVSGYGYVARGSGVTVFIEEINAKRSPSIAVVEVNYAFPSPRSLTYDAGRQLLQINMESDNEFRQLEIMDISGRVVYSSSSYSQQLPLGQFPSNLYFVRLQTALGVENLKIMVLP